MDIKAPTFPESITEGTIAVWHKGAGEPIRRDDLLVDIETDKVVLEVVAPADGQLVRIFKQEGDVVESEERLATFEIGEVATSRSAAAVEPPASAAPAASASPAARKLAEEKGLDIAKVQAPARMGASPRRTWPSTSSRNGPRHRPRPPPPSKSMIRKTRVVWRFPTKPWASAWNAAFQ